MYFKAAGPHTQLAQNLVAAYYAGARFFELKTVQKMDGPSFLHAFQETVSWRKMRHITANGLQNFMFRRQWLSILRWMDTYSCDRKDLDLEVRMDSSSTYVLWLQP